MNRQATTPPNKATTSAKSGYGTSHIRIWSAVFMAHYHLCGKNTAIMRVIISLLLLSGTVSTVTAQSGWTDRTRVLPDTLRHIPHGISIQHSPNPVYPVRENGQYVWKHTTQVTALADDLEVVFAGSFIWFSEKGWIPNMELDRRAFSRKFNCPKGNLKKGKTYTFKRNYRYGQQAYGGDALWFVLARDTSGKIFKGIGLVETEAEATPANK